jgi:hypothetical protein
VLISAWIAGFSLGRWGAGVETPLFEFGSALGVPKPDGPGWWAPLIYFPLTVIAAFVVSELFFGAVAPVFIFSRGLWDSTILSALEHTLRGLDITSITGGQVWTIFYYILIFVGNLPLCVWASHLGVVRSLRTLQRLQGKPLRPETGLASSLLALIAVASVLGLLGALALSYAA